MCRVDLKFNESICSDLNSHEAEGNKVQAQVDNGHQRKYHELFEIFVVQVTKLELYKTLITAFPCIFISTLLATWLHPDYLDRPAHHNILMVRSDRTGRRKPLIILPMLGDLLSLLIYLLNVYFKVNLIDDMVIGDII